MQMKTKGLKTRGKRNESALTLPEVVVATAILAIGYVGLYGVMTFGWTTAKESRENLRATEVLDQKMEQIRLYSWLQVTDTVNYMNPAPLVQYYDPSNTNKDPVYWCTVSLANVPSGFPSSYNNDMRQVTVVVQWTNYSGGVEYIPHARTNQTYVAHYGLQNYVINSP